MGKRLNDLDATTSLNDNDLLLTSQLSNGKYIDKKITKSNLSSSILNSLDVSSTALFSKGTGANANKITIKAIKEVDGKISTDTTADNTVTLAAVAKTGSYNDLSNKPTIPTVNNSTITIQKNGTAVGSFTLNQSSNKSINIQIPSNLVAVPDYDLNKSVKVFNGVTIPEAGFVHGDAFFYINGFYFPAGSFAPVSPGDMIQIGESTSLSTYSVAYLPLKIIDSSSSSISNWTSIFNNERLTGTSTKTIGSSGLLFYEININTTNYVEIYVYINGSPMEQLIGNGTSRRWIKVTGGDEFKITYVEQSTSTATITAKLGTYS